MEAVKSLGILDSILLSNYILQRYAPMSHLKLQKLLYYSEAYHLAYFDKGLSNCEFEAWVHGPVCREVFDNLKDKSLLYADLKYEGEDQIEKVKAVLTSKQLEILDDVLAELSKWSDIELETATHNELPWISARGGIDPAARCNNVIDPNLIRTFYKKELGLSN